MTNATPWTDYQTALRTARGAWDCANYPFIVRWYVSSNAHRLTHWTTNIREFKTLEEAVAAYKRPFRGLSVDLMFYNGKEPGKHLDQLARRKCGKPTKWHESVPKEVRTVELGYTGTFSQPGAPQFFTAGE